MLDPNRTLRRGTLAATQRVVAAFQSLGFEARFVRTVIDGADFCGVTLEGYDGVTVWASCAEDEPDSAWIVSAEVPGFELASRELPDLLRTSPAERVVRAIIPYLSMSRREFINLN